MRAAAYLSPAGLAYLSSHGHYSYPPHVELIDAALQDVAAGRCLRLIVTMPPRHGKSQLCSATFPAWYLGRYPERRVILASYEAGFAATWGRKARSLIEEWGPRVFGVKVDARSSAADRWDIEGHAGGMVTAGVGGGITGKGAHCLIIDDPLKNAEEAQSQTIRDKVWEFYLSTAFTRLESNPEGAVIVIATRWHEDDLIGRLLAQPEDEFEEQEQWRVLNLPAIAEEGDALGREPGAALWPGRFPIERLERIRNRLTSRLGSRWWWALYQQRPAPEEGGIIKLDWLKYWDTLPQAATWIQSWDMSFKDTDDGSFVVGQVWCKSGADCYLVHQVRGRWDFPQTQEQVKALTQLYPQAAAKLIEDKANGPAIIASLKRVVPGLIPVQVEGNKEARLSAVSPLFESGNVWLPHAHWVADYVSEMISFPNAAHDDQADTTSQALRHLMGRPILGTPIVGGERKVVMGYKPR